MKKSFEIRKELATATEKFQVLAGKDQRTAEEQSEMDSLRTVVRNTTSALDDAELIEAGQKRTASQNLNDKERATVASFSFSRAINEYLKNGRNADAITGLEGEMHKEAILELRNSGVVTKTRFDGFGVPLMVLENSRASTGQNVTTAGDGGNLVQTEPYLFIESLKNALILPELGARFLTGLVGNLPLLKGGSFTSAFVAEGSAASFTKEAFTKATMTPKNLMVAGAISKQLLVQTNNIAEMLIRDELIAAIARGIQNAAINGAGTPAPTGILATSGIGSVVMGTDGLAMDWASIVKLETEIYQDNVMGEIAYLINAKTRGKLKTTLKASGVSGYIMENNEINGYKTAMSNVVPSDITKAGGSNLSAVIAGVWSELFIGLWGGLDIVVDPYTRADYNEVKLVVNQFADVALRNAEAFAACKDAVA